jgi:hypothetical protein
MYPNLLTTFSGGDSQNYSTVDSGLASKLACLGRSIDTVELLKKQRGTVYFTPPPAITCPSTSTSAPYVRHLPYNHSLRCSTRCSFPVLLLH